MDIRLKNINKVFGNYKALDDVSFEIEKGKLIGLLGPSGSGKTTILRILAGLEYQDSGDVYLDGVLVNELSASRRGIGFVFQSYGLFPYMTVYDNIAYGLKVQKKSKDYIKNRVSELLELVELPGLEKRYPSQLSGGQMQRIAFARALAPNPQLLLLDEPFAAIDAKVRKELRSWLREMITKIGITSIFVTHDQDEAVEVADEIIITNKGRIEQIGTPIELYKNPRTPFVAQFIGQSTVIGEYRKLKGFETLEEGFRAVIRPEFIKVYKYGAQKEHFSVLEEGIVRNAVFRGDCTEVTIEVKGNLLKTIRALDDEGVEIGEKVQLLLSRCYVFDDEKAYSVTNKGLDEADTFYI
ncbi:sulfate/molybdate ABC transporter ATP-binding protein [Anaerocolumna xylanovorans]|uniref:ABC-type quaternary amine transporter n=1 Tax=Anaerocolumna xylanovorans DSM 12503 TaxID=1121345 RepID=A0A1M7Y5G5_9FIRM|nr:sulfate ABC transporter ATP-binding protein [Anaerocolumna xylanovorans]SHO47729.1 sulfate transport system ATP-binding protein [Anaerocolumna xylanovorans DSM 12503]